MIVQPEFAGLVERKIETVASEIDAGVHVDGWSLGPERIIREAAEETIDIPAWLRGLDQHPKPEGAEELVGTIVNDAAILWDALERLADMYR